MASMLSIAFMRPPTQALPAAVNRSSSAFAAGNAKSPAVVGKVEFGVEQHFDYARCSAPYTLTTLVVGLDGARYTSGQVAYFFERQSPHFKVAP